MPAIQIICAATLSTALLISTGLQAVDDVARRSSKANSLIEAGKPEQAIPIYRQLSSDFPSELSYQVNLVVALFKAGRYQETIDQCSTLLSHQPDLFAAWLFLGASHLKLNSPGTALQPLRKAFALRENDPNASIMLADALLATKHLSEAANQYRTLVKVMPQSPRVWYGLNLSYQALAEDSLKLIENMASGSPEDLALNAQLELQHGQIAPAFQHFRQALALQPHFAGLHSQIAEIYRTAGHPDWAEVEKAQERADETCTAESFECRFLSGHLQELATASATSLEDLYWFARASIALSGEANNRLGELPPSRERYEALAASEEERGRYPEAARAWKQSLQFEPSDTGIQRHLALALCHANDCVSALPMLKEQLIHEPDSAELNYLYGLALQSTRDTSNAIAYLEKSVRIDGHFTPAHAALGEAYLEADKPHQAVPHLKIAISEDTNGIRHYQLARAYQALGMRNEAAVALSEYRQISLRQKTLDSPDTSITPP